MVVVWLETQGGRGKREEAGETELGVGERKRKGKVGAVEFRDEVRERERERGFSLQ